MKKLRLLSLLLCVALLCQTAIPASAAETVASTQETQPAEQQTAQIPFGQVCIENGCRTLNGMRPLAGSDSRLDTAVAAFAAQLDPTLAEIGDIKTAVSEAVTNAVVHAYPDKLGTVQVRVRILPDERLEIAVKDHGIGIADVAQARTPLYTTGGEERSGMGFTIMESFMDTLRVKSVPGRGTTVTMCRRIRRRA